MTKHIIIFSILIVTGILAVNCQKSLKEKGMQLSPISLRCEFLKNPLGIDVVQPRLSWNFTANGENQQQRAYQILTASSEENLKSGIGDLWDSGKVNSGQSVLVPYSGKKLTSRMRAFWKVRVWDQDDHSSQWSRMAKWEMSLLDSSDWKAQWIGVSEDKNPGSTQTDPAPYFRKQFKLKKTVQSARVYVSGLGYYELYLNGKKVGDDVLAPSPTNYDRRNLRHTPYPYDDQSTTRVLYNTFDVSEYLNTGENAAGMILGNGWYNQRDRTAEGWMWYDTPRLILQLEIHYTDGTSKTIISNDSWRVATGPILHDAIFTGEVYDARLETDGWNLPGFNDSHWKNARLVRAPTGRLVAQMNPPDKVVKTLRPVSLTSPEENVYVYDFGQMFSGWVRLKIKGRKGTKIVLRYFEEMDGDYRQKDVYILRGGGVETYEPRFTWHAFRKVKVSGAPVQLTLDNLEGMVVNTAVDTVGHFACSNELFNKIYKNYIWTQLGNFHGSYSSDCPHRERLGYTGDGQLLVESAIFNFDMAQFYRKWLNDINDARNKKTGFVPHTAPFGGGGGGPAWGSSYVIVPWFYYLYYGDARILLKHYPGMKQWVEYLGTRTNKDGIVVREEPGGWCLGDWAAPGGVEIPPPFVNTCYYYYVTKIMARVAHILDKKQDEAWFAERAKEIKAAVDDKFFDKENTRYWTSRQGADAFPLAFGMVPKKYVSGVLASLIKNVLKNKGHFDTGILATPLMLDVLTKYGRADIAFTLMNQRDYPSYGDYILGKGATTLWEYWDGKLSHSHPMYGSVIRWFFKALAGINPDPKNPGFKHIIVKPAVCGDLTFVNADYRSVYGVISSQWKLKKDDLYLNVTIPPNTTATVYVPAIDSTSVRAKTSRNNQENVSFVNMQNNAAVYEIGSGRYEFISKKMRSLIKPVHVATPVVLPRDSLFVLPQKAEVTIGSATKGANIYITPSTAANPRMNRKNMCERSS
ncbi:MAG: family 78 glycoside hydrolase catalytic domain [Calditrichaeota bacterium]|nr:family 78 glycoside hydrolase catalytic domain [Calditrichota bacterium]